MRSKFRLIVSSIFVISAVIGLAIWFCMKPPAPQVSIITDQIFAMGSTCRITVFAVEKSEAEIRSVIDSAMGRITSVDKSCSLYSADSDINRTNASAFSADTDIQGLFRDCILKSLDANKYTDGVFNPLLRPLLASWGFEPGSKENRVPSQEEIIRGIELSDMKSLVISEQGQKVRFLREGMGFDLNGIAQGIATENAADELIRLGVKSALVESGGGEFSVIGVKPDGLPFRIGIRKPSRESNDIICTVLLADKSLATSGDYEKFFTVDGVNYSHLIDPRTGRPRTGNSLSVTVIGPSCSKCDALATACAILGPQEAIKLISKNPEYEVIIVERTGTGDKFHVSPGIGKTGEDYYLLSQKDIVERPDK